MQLSLSIEGECAGTSSQFPVKMQDDVETKNSHEDHQSLSIILSRDSMLGNIGREQASDRMRNVVTVGAYAGSLIRGASKSPRLLLWGEAYLQ